MNIFKKDKRIILELKIPVLAETSLTHFPSYWHFSKHFGKGSSTFGTQISYSRNYQNQ